MPAPPTGDEFLELVRKSGVVDEKRLVPYREQDGKALFASEPGKLAGLLVRDGILTRFQAEQFLQGKWRRFTIGKYKVLDRIGTGGMGSVYLCEHKFMRRLAAVKVLPTARAKDPSALERFYREARAVAALDHPNIVRAYDIDQENDLHFLVMEYVDGASLQEIVRREGPLDPVRCANYTSQAALGLQHAHEVAAIVHRDIKPGNLIVDRSGTVKLLDMGLARFFNDEGDLLTKKYDENVLGTADYLAPEQVLDSHGVDIRADIYSLGATAYFCLTSRTPFGEGTVAQKLIWHQTRQPKPIRSFRSDVPEGLLAVLDKMMAKDVAGRYQTPAEVVRALAPWTKAQALQAPASPVPKREAASSAGANSLPKAVEAGKSAAETPPQTRKPQASAAGAQSRSGMGVSEAAFGAPEKRSGAPVKPNGNEAQLGAGGFTSSAKCEASSVPEILVPFPAGGGPGEENDSLPWENITSDTPQPILKADTARNTPLRMPKPKALPFRQTKVKRQLQEWLRLEGPRLWWAVGLASALALVSLFLLILCWPSSGKKIVSEPMGPTEDLRVTRVDQLDGVSAFDGLRYAWRTAPTGWTILVSSPVIEGSVDLTGKRGITIKAKEGMKVVWRPSDKASEKNLVYFHDVEDVVFQGFELDGQNRIDSLAELAMACPGVELRNLKLRGFRRAGLVVANCSGKVDRPVILSGLSFIGNPEREAGIFFELNPKITDPISNDYIQFTDCNFTGVKAKWKGPTKLGALGPNVTLP